MTDEDGFKKVTKDEYIRFVRNYPARLVFDLTAICEPPMGSYNDFSDGKEWPESMVAKHFCGWLGQDGEIDNSQYGKFWEYYIT